MFTVNVSNCYQGFHHWNQWALQRTTQGIISLLLSLRKCPAIRYQASSEICKRLAENLRQTIAREGSLFDFQKASSFGADVNTTPILLLLDRKSDPITPCLNQVFFFF